MSAPVSLNLLNSLPKRDKMIGKPRILSLFRSKFNKFNNTGAPMLDSIYHMTLKLFWNHIFGVKTLGFCHMQDIKSVISYFPKICKPLVFYWFYCMALFHSQMRHHMINWDKMSTHSSHNVAFVHDVRNFLYQCGKRHYMGPAQKRREHSNGSQCQIAVLWNCVLDSKSDQNSWTPDCNANISSSWLVSSYQDS